MYRTAEQRALTLRRSERTRRANAIIRLIPWVISIPETAVPFWRDTILYGDVRKLVRVCREWGWIE